MEKYLSLWNEKEEDNNGVVGSQPVLVGSGQQNNEGFINLQSTRATASENGQTIYAIMQNVRNFYGNHPFFPSNEPPRPSWSLYRSSMYNGDDQIIDKRSSTFVANDYWRRKKAFSHPKDIVDFLKLLIHRNGSVTPQVYDGSNKIKTDIEIFKQKHVLLFISSLNRIDDKILVLNSIYDGLQENPEEIIKGYKKGDFKILWIPIVEGVWEYSQMIKFNNLKNKIKWYVVEYFYELPGIGLIRENLNYVGDAIIPVINSQGDIINGDAMHLIFQWGIDAFPFKKIDGDVIATITCPNTMCGRVMEVTSINYKCWHSDGSDSGNGKI